MSFQVDHVAIISRKVLPCFAIMLLHAADTHHMALCSCCCKGHSTHSARKPGHMHRHTSKPEVGTWYQQGLYISAGTRVGVARILKSQPCRRHAPAPLLPAGRVVLT
jgi:hypothetical protein